MADPITLNLAIVAANMAFQASRKIESPRPTTAKVTTASYGAPYTYGYGKPPPVVCICVWAEELRAVKRQRKTKGGKYNDWTFYGTAAYQIADHPIAAVTRIWFDEHLVYDTTGAGPVTAFDLGGGTVSDFITIYLGEYDAEPDERMAATIDAEFGEGSTRAFRGEAGLVIKDLPVEKLGNRYPQVKVEYVTAGTPAFPYESRSPVSGQLTSHQGMAWSPDGTRLYFGWDWEAGYDIWDVNARALMVGGATRSPQDDEVAATQFTIGVVRSGDIWLVTYGGMMLRCDPDGFSGSIMNHLDPLTNEPIPFPFIDRCFSVSYNLDGPGGPPENDRDVVFAFRSTGLEGAWWWQTGWLKALPMGGDLNVEAGTETWAPAFGFPDLDGHVWLAGAVGIGLDPIWEPEDLLFRRVIGGGETFAVTMPSVVSSVIGCFHYRNEALEIDCFIVAYQGPDGEHIVAVDPETRTVVLEAPDVATPFSTPTLHSFRNIRPGASTFWAGGTEYSSTDLSVIRSYDLADYIPGAVTDPEPIYDRALHALFVAFDDEFAWLYLDRVTGEGVSLKTIVDDIGQRCGLTEGTDFDASALSAITVKGFSWTQQAGKQALGGILEAFDVEARPHNFLLEFIERGGESQGTIPVAGMGAGGAARYVTTEVVDGDLTKFVDLLFADPEMDGQPNTAGDQRSGDAVDTNRTLTLDVTTLVLDKDDARRKAIGFQRRTWYGAQKVETSLSRGWSALEPGDVWDLALDTVTLTAKVVSLEKGADGVLRLSLERDAPSLHTPSALSGAAGEGYEPGEVLVPSYTKGQVLDIPLVSDAHDATVPFVYLAGSPYSDEVVWPGAIFYRGDDNLAFEEELGVVESDQAAVIGHALSALPEALATCWDEASVLTIKLMSGELTSATKAEVANGANAAAIWNATAGGWEIVRFRTATLTAPLTYDVSGFLRGRRGTEQMIPDHAIGDVFVLLDGLPRGDMGASDVDEVVYVRPTTNGGPAGFTQTLNPYTGAALKPYAPCHLAIVDSGGDYVLTATRRTRIGGNWSDYQDVPLGESSEAYVGYILDAGGDVIRTYTGLTSPTYTYTAADQASDGGLGVTMGIAQVSTIVGAGYRSQLAVPA